MSKKIPEINSGSMADISFLLLTFFLLTSSINTDLGITRKLPPPPDPNAPIPEVKTRNVLKVLVNKSDRLLVQNKLLINRSLKNAKNFLSKSDQQSGFT
jgi:biopolymer transport protein ExbD